MRLTKEGGIQYEHMLDHALEFFNKAGSLFEEREAFYGSGYDPEESALSLFQKTYIVDKVISTKLLLWLRDCRGGAGNRSGARTCMHWLANHDPEWFSRHIGWIPLVGRWDDLRALFGTPLEEDAVSLWREALLKKDVLAAKWADRTGLKIGDFRRFLASLRKNHIVEHKMCSNEWSSIDYETVPSVAMARYTNAFGRHDAERFEAYKEALKKGTAKIHSDVLFPHDCVRTVYFGDTEIADAQFEALPNFLENSNEKAIVIADTSGSMSVLVSGSVQAVDISQGLALYFSAAIGSTRIDRALGLILKTAKFFNLSKDQMPTMLLIVSDMQFHQGIRGDGTEVEKALARWKRAGYDIPKIVYWNTAGYVGSPSTKFAKNVGLISGFSPSILKAVLSGEDFSPIAIMLRALEKYNIEV